MHIASEKRFNKLIESFSTQGKLMHVHKLLGRAAQLWPDRSMVICGDDEITYAHVHKRAQLLAKILQQKGVHKGDRVLIFYENSIEFYVAYFAVWYAGAIVTPLNVFLSEHELRQIIHDAQPKVLIISPTLSPKLATFPQAELPHILSHIDIKTELPSKVEEVVMKEEQDEDDTVALLYTSGTTGFPKGVMLTSKNIMTNTLQGVSSFEVGKSERIFCPLPLFHSLPQNVCVWGIMIVGATAILVPKIDRRSILRGIEHNPTIVIAVPAVYGLFCMLKTIQFGAVKYFVAGGDALSDKIRAFFAMIYGRKIANGYGLTETSPFISVDFDDYTQPTNTIGRPIHGINYEIRDEQGKVVPQGSIGVLWVTGNNIMKGYYNAPEATQEVLKNGWLNTGDLAYNTPEGKVVLAGRERDLISNKGLKIYPQEIENILLSHPAVLQAGVIGVALEGDEEVPVAYVGTKEPEDHYDELIEKLRIICQRNLASYKVPRQFYVVRELTVTTTGKVDKKILRKEHENVIKDS